MKNTFRTTKYLFVISALTVCSTPAFSQVMVPAISQVDPATGLPATTTMMSPVPPIMMPPMSPVSKGTIDLKPQASSPIMQQDNTSVNPASGVSYPITPPPVINPINQNPVTLTNKETAGVNITKKWRTRRAMPASGSNGTVVFTYGATQPSIVCAPLTVCLLKLEAGEKLVKNGLQIGDGTRWLISPSRSGDRMVLVIKPTDAGLRTTLAIMTNKRVYAINLVSVAAQNRSMAISEFSYPEEVQKQWNEYYAQQAQAKQDNTMENGRDVSQLDFKYKIKGKTSWRPTRVYSDGVHTFIQFPASMASGDAPSLLALANDGGIFSSPTQELVNYRKEGNTYVVDKVLNKAELVLGVGSSKEKVTIKHEN
ncbi:P-type conjugative transfer protein TrbG [Commensalibacter nepenthis]|uniref:P-type conjugative transfer protein TrbG n=1 Tax=Commensalibacter nepenthis TaxID=3043872 RepID=A0ABT6QAF0_9PROT|nr:P-type conjugative transfer protein TrbG [Commensalibacter sp. TBRC 10068]MDI2113885.1 P-type conjugative transfer protein TrbG [Commensalibacter sp. TBRC 10068]